MPPKPPATPEEWNLWDAQHPGADPLAEAKITLQKANDFGAENNSARLAALPESLTGLRSAADTRGTGRKITEGLAHVGEGLGYGALGTAFVGAEPLAAGLGAASSAAMLPDYLRRMLAPDQNEQRPGALETGATLLPYALPRGISALRGLKSAAKDAPLEIQRGSEMFVDASSRAGGLRATKNAAEHVLRIPYAEPTPWSPASQGQAMFEEAAGRSGGLPKNMGDIRKSTALNDLRAAVDNHVAKTARAADYQDELGRVLRNDAPAYSETGHPPSTPYRPENDPSVTWNYDLRDKLAKQRGADISAEPLGPANVPESQRVRTIIPAGDPYDRAMATGGRYGPNSDPAELPSSWRNLPSDAEAKLEVLSRRARNQKKKAS